MNTLSKRELIERGYAPSIKRAKMSIPFMLPLACPDEHYQRLPKEIQKQFDPSGKYHKFIGG